MSERAQKEIAAAKKKNPRGAGRKPGFAHDPRTIERIRASINAKLAIDTLHEMALEGGQHDSVRVQAATVLLKKVLPDLTATDITSNGEKLIIERTAFKQP
jgi:hypothetical protein